MSRVQPRQAFRGGRTGCSAAGTLVSPIIADFVGGSLPASWVSPGQAGRGTLDQICYQE
jgi:hypothetical protein